MMTELTSQGFNLYVNDGEARFRDQGAVSGLGPASANAAAHSGRGWRRTCSRSAPKPGA